MDFLIHPAQADRLIQIKLPSPKDGEPDKVYLVDQIHFQVNEIVKFSDNFRSWFADNSFSKDGSFYMITPVDRLFIMLPFILKSKDQFRTLNDIISSTEHYDDLALVLSPQTDWNLVCDTKDIDDELYIRYNKDKVIIWLETKRIKIIETLRKEMEPTTSLATHRSYANDLLADYLPTELTGMLKKVAVGDEVLVEKTASEASAKDSSTMSSKTRPFATGSKRRSDSKESVKSDNSNHKLTKWFNHLRH